MSFACWRPGRRAVLAAALAAPLLSRRARAAGISITDALGRTITLPGPAERIVLGFNYEEYTAVAGAAGWERVVGFARTLWSSWRPSIYTRYLKPIPRLADLPDVGNTDDGTFSLERVIALRPDLVIMAEWSFRSLSAAVARLEALDIPVLVIDYNAERIERHVASTLALGMVTGNEDRAQELARLYAARMNDIARRLAGVTARPKAYIELGQGGAGVVGNTYANAMWARLLGVAGGDNIADGHIAGDYQPLNPEYVLAADPAVIFIAGSSWVGRPNAVLTGFDADVATTRARLAPYAARPGWAGLTAIRDGQLHAIEHGLCRALFDYTATLYLARQLHPARFTDIDPVAELRLYHQCYLPVPFEGCWMTSSGPRT